MGSIFNIGCWQKISFQLSFNKICQWPCTCCLCCCLTELWTKFHDSKILSSAYLKTWPWDSYHFFYKRKTLHSDVHSYRGTWPRNSGPRQTLLQDVLLLLTSSNRYTKQGTQQASNCSFLTSSRSKQQAYCTSPLQWGRVSHTWEVLPVVCNSQSCSNATAMTNSHHAEWQIQRIHSYKKLTQDIEHYYLPGI